MPSSCSRGGSLRCDRPQGVRLDTRRPDCLDYFHAILSVLLVHLLERRQVLTVVVLVQSLQRRDHRLLNTSCMTSGTHLNASQDANGAAPAGSDRCLQMPICRSNCFTSSAYGSDEQMFGTE